MTCVDKILSRSHEGASRNFCYHGLGKMFQVLQEFSRSCIKWQGLSSFLSQGKQKLNLIAFLKQKVEHVGFIWL